MGNGENFWGQSNFLPATGHLPLAYFLVGKCLDSIFIKESLNIKKSSFETASHDISVNDPILFPGRVRRMVLSERRSRRSRYMCIIFLERGKLGGDLTVLRLSSGKNGAVDLR